MQNCAYDRPLTGSQNTQGKDRKRTRRGAGERMERREETAEEEGSAKLCPLTVLSPARCCRAGAAAGSVGGPPISRRRGFCYVDDTPCESPLKHVTNVQGGAIKSQSRADGYQWRQAASRWLGLAGTRSRAEPKRWRAGRSDRFASSLQVPRAMTAVTCSTTTQCSRGTKEMVCR